MFERYVKTRKTAAILMAASILFSTCAPVAAAAGDTQKTAKTAKTAAKPVAPKKVDPINATIDFMTFTNSQLGFILQALAQACGANFSVSAAAASRILTLEFGREQKATFKDVIDMIRQTAAVTIDEVGPMAYIVRTSEEAESKNKNLTEKARELEETEKRIANGVMKTFVMNYVAATDASNTLKNILGSQAKSVCSVSVLGDTDSESDSSSSSSTQQKREYSTIVVYASNSNIMRHIENILADIDRPKPMVEVEAVFVEVSQNRNKETGVDWTILDTPINFAEEVIGTAVIGDADDTPIYNKTKIGTMRRITGATGSVALNLTEGSGKGRVLSNPRIRVMSGHVASFASETQVPIMNKDSDGEIKTEYKNVGVNLDIQPIVLENDQIYLTVKPSVSAITDTVTLGDTQAPQIAARNAETTLLMKDGETMVIGGLLSDRDIKSMAKVPILWKIPLFGELFKSESITKEHSSISVYIRLKLIEDYMNGVPAKASTIPQNKIDMLINGLKPSDLKAADKESGAFKEETKIQGVIPTKMTEPEFKRVEITPVTTELPKSTVPDMTLKEQEKDKDKKSEAEKPETKAAAETDKQPANTDAKETFAVKPDVKDDTKLKDDTKPEVKESAKAEAADPVLPPAPQPPAEPQPVKEKQAEVKTAENKKAEDKKAEDGVASDDSEEVIRFLY